MSGQSMRAQMRRWIAVVVSCLAAAGSAAAQDRQKPPPVRTGGPAALVLELAGVRQHGVRCAATTARLAVETSRDGKRTGRGDTQRGEAIVVELPLQPEPALRTWLADALAGRAAPCDGALLELGGTSVFAHQMQGITLRRLALPPLDAGDRSSVEWSVELAAASLRYVASGSGGKDATGGAKLSPTERSAFRVSVDGVECPEVLAIGSLEIVVAGAADTGTSRARSAAVVSPFEVSVTDAGAANWIAWLDAAATAAPGATRTLAIDLLDRSRRDVLATVKLTNATPRTLRREIPGGTGSDARGRFVAELTAAGCEVGFPGK